MTKKAANQEFTLFGRPIKISEGTKNYLRIINDFAQMGVEAQHQFHDDYDSIFGLVFLNSTYVEKFSKTYGSDGYMDNIVKRYVTKTRQYLAGHGVFDLSETTIWKEGVLADEDQYESKLQFALNDFILDCAADEIDDDRFASRAKSKFSGSYFTTILYNEIMRLCDYTIAYLSDNEIVEIQYVYKNDAERAAAIFENLRDTVVTTEDEMEFFSKIVNLSREEAERVIDQSGGSLAKVNASTRELEEMAYSLIELDPRKDEYYKHIIVNLPQARYEIAEIAAYLEIDLSEEIDELLSHLFNLSMINSEEQALDMMEKLKAEMGRLHVSNSETYDKLVKILNDYDIKARTYDGVLYATREERANAERQDTELATLCGDIDALNKDDCISRMLEINNKSYIASIKDKYLKCLRDRIEEIDYAYMEELVKDLGSKTEEECNAIKSSIAAYNTSDEIKEEFYERVDQKIQLIWDLEDRARFSEMYKQTTPSDFGQIQSNIAIIRESGRTASKELFIKAMSMLKREEVAQAAKYAVAKEGGMFSSLLNIGKKGTYETLTIGGTVMHPAILDAMEEVRAQKSGGLFGGFMKKKAASEAASPASGNKFCSACGAKLNGGEKFCGSCGNKIG